MTAKKQHNSDATDRAWAYGHIVYLRHTEDGMGHQAKNKGLAHAT
ncbi:hypothetical protein GCM10009129_21950 [Psychrobacter aestuarii]|uniref:Integrase n=1 Tax=Psychrobacter aestuarii TaxID=556327 RepID=A0ABN0W3M4_9GAMM